MLRHPSGAPVRCPYCQQDDDRVIDSRETDDGTAIRRRRVCSACNKRFTTYERVEGEETLRVMKKDGRVQTFDRKKLLHGMTVACEKRPVPTAELEAATNRIHHALLGAGEREVPTARIGELVMQELHRLDQVAYVRFASVYRQFKDLDEFMSELKKVLGTAERS
jgi:transcriptional repressor NrdR